MSPVPDNLTATAASETCFLMYCSLLLLIAEDRVARGVDADTSETLADAAGWLGSLARAAPAIRFADAPATADPAAEILAAQHARLRSLAPLLSRLHRPGADPRAAAGFGEF